MTTSQIPNLIYNVATIRAAGLEAKWSKNSKGAPIIVARNKPGTWYFVDRKMWEAAQKEGIAEAFGRFTLLGDFFSIPA